MLRRVGLFKLQHTHTFLSFSQPGSYAAQAVNAEYNRTILLGPPVALTTVEESWFAKVCSYIILQMYQPSIDL